MLAVHPQFDTASWCLSFKDNPIFANMPALSPPGQDSPYNRLLTIFRQLSYLTTQLSRLRKDRRRISDCDMSAWGKARSCVECALLSVSLIRVAMITDTAKYNKTKVSDTTLAFEALRLAALIYLNVVLRECALRGPVLQSLKAQLLDVLWRTNSLATSLRSRPRRAIWIFFMGGLLAVKDTEESWFAERIAETMQDMGIHSWEETVDVLEKTLWVDALKVKIWRGLWQKIQ